MVATIVYVFIGKLLGPKGIFAGRGGGRRRGVFNTSGEGMEDLEFGFCFEVSTGNRSDGRRQTRLENDKVLLSIVINHIF